MHRILLVTDVPWVRNEVHAALTTPEFELIDTEDAPGAGALAYASEADAVVIDLQVASRGGMAITRDVRNYADLNDAAHIPVVMLMDRAADGFLAKRAGAVAWVTKPLAGHEILMAVRNALAPPAVTDDVLESADDAPDTAPVAEPV